MDFAPVIRVSTYLHSCSYSLFGLPRACTWLPPHPLSLNCAPAVMYVGGEWRSSRVKKARDGIFLQRASERATSARARARCLSLSLGHYFIAVERMNSLMHPLGDHPTLSLPRRSDDCRALFHVSRVSIQYLHMGANNLCLNTSICC